MCGYICQDDVLMPETLTKPVFYLHIMNTYSEELLVGWWVGALVG